jgi:hypothetical protein
MKHVDLVCELLISVHQNDVINRKVALDKVMVASSFSIAHARNASAKLIATLNRFRRMVPKLYSTRTSRCS